MLLHQNQLFSYEEVLSIRGYTKVLKDRIIGTYHPDVNNGEHDPAGGHNLADHLPWNSSVEYNWIFDKIIGWLNTLDLPFPVDNLGGEFIVQKYLPGFEFKPHIDHVLSPDKKTILRERMYTILIQLSSEDEYKGGELFVKTADSHQISKTPGTVCIFGPAQLHWVNKITDGERWSCTIFLEKDALKKTLL